MSDFNLGNFTNKFNNYTPLNTNSGGPKTPNSNIGPDGQFQIPKETLGQELVQKTLAQQTGILSTFGSSILAELRMNNLASVGRSLYIKDLMKFPKDMEEVLVLLQNNAEMTPEAVKLLTTNINLATLAELIQKSGKEAMNKLILVMANASKQGITDTSQIKDAIKFINASVSVAAQENPTQILKSFMLLYLPWLPLKEGVDFDLEVESYENNEGETETSITILISTLNYGNIRVTLILVKGHSIEIFINCCEKFPKGELLKRINEEGKAHSIQSNVTFEQKEMKNDGQQAENITRQAKISMSNLTEVNPFLLLMANAVIRHTIELDNLIN